MENIPEKFLNQDGTLNSDALIKSYTELEKKIGGMISVPDENSDADAQTRFRRAIGVPESADDYPHNELFDNENVRQEFHNIGLTKNQVEKIYDIANEFLSPMLHEIVSAQNESNAMSELKEFFGSDETKSLIFRYYLFVVSDSCHGNRSGSQWRKGFLRIPVPGVRR